MRKEALAKELNEEADISDGEDVRQVKAPASRKTSLSPTQFLQSKAHEHLSRSRAIGREATRNPLVLPPLFRF